MLGSRVRLRREELGITQAELSQRIGLSRASVANIEAGRQAVLLHQFLILADALSLMPTEMLPLRSTIKPASELPESVKNFMSNLDLDVQKRNRPAR